MSLDNINEKLNDIIKVDPEEGPIADNEKSWKYHVSIFDLILTN